MRIENQDTGRFFTFHRFKFPNTRTTPTLVNPTLKIGWAVASLGSTTNITMKGASAYGGIDGPLHPFRRPEAHVAQNASVGNTFEPIFSIRVRSTFDGVVQLSEAYPKLLSVTPDGSKSCQVKVLLNDSLTGTPNWQYIDEDNSIAEYDESATGLSGDGALIAAATTFGGIPAEIRFNDLAEDGITPLHLERGDVLTIAARITSGSAQPVDASLTWNED